MSWLSQGISDDPHLESRTMGKGWGWECCLLVCLCGFYLAFPVDLVTCVAQLSKGRQWKEIIAVIQPYFPRNWDKSNHCHKLFHGFAFLKSSSLWDSNSIPENNILKKKKVLEQYSTLMTTEFISLGFMNPVYKAASLLWAYESS